MRRLLTIILVICTLATSYSVIAEDIAIKEYEYVDGIKCKKRQNIITYLFMGIDDYGQVHAKMNEDDIPGQCDVLILLVIDKAADTYALIPINRNTITQVHAISDYDGSDLGAYPMQIALAHTNGDGLEQSCEIVVKAVSDLLLGVDIDHYSAVNMDVIKILNNAVGGVTVTIEDDFSQMDPTLIMGETLKLTDDQAENFIRGRMLVENGANEDRMRRQRQYMEAIKPMLMEKYEQNVTFPLDLVHSMSDYMVTDMTDKDFSYIAKALQKNTYLGTYEISGTTTIDSNGWEAFDPDGQSITDTVIELFYKKVAEKEEGLNK